MALSKSEGGRSKNMDWIQLLTLIGTMLATVIGIVIPLHIHTLSHLKAIAEEMKDFHGRLCAIEERRGKE